MCGITGYIGSRSAVPLVVDQLTRLEYRGYDSAGVAARANGHVEILKTQGKIARLQELLSGNPVEAFSAIAHTRWATHGRPSTPNAHPHTDSTGRIAVVHNGIIENYLALRQRLQLAGHTFASETDTEVLPHLIESYYEGDLLAAVRRALADVRGSYAMVVLSTVEPDLLVAARKDSPLVIGLGQDGNYVASDIPALLAHTRDVIILEDEDIALIRKDGVTITKLDGTAVERPVMKVTWDAQAAAKGGYEHFMRKEIHEQPGTIRDTLRGRVTPDGKVDLSELKLSREALAKVERIYMVACGTAYHAGLVGKAFLERRLGLPVEADLASEFRYREPVLSDKTLVVVISQSGETADTIAALREAQSHGAPTIGIVNVMGSTLSREAGAVLHTQAGPEICVASTKAYVSQLVGLYLLGAWVARERGKITEAEEREIVAGLQALPAAVEQVLEQEKEIDLLAQQFAGCRDFFFLGRGLDYALAMEGALKLKEISYIHSEALAAGEMKHGTLALVTTGVTTICLATQEKLIEKMMSNLKEVKARDATAIGVTSSEEVAADPSIDHVIQIPKVLGELRPVVAIVPLQLLAYHIARHNGARSTSRATWPKASPSSELRIADCGLRIWAGEETKLAPDDSSSNPQSAIRNPQLNDCEIHTNLSIDRKEAALSLVSVIGATETMPIVARVEILEGGLPVTGVEDPISAFPGETSLVQSLTIRGVRLWWPNGLGEQPLYEARVGLFSREGEFLDGRTIPFGVRQLEIVVEETAAGTPGVASLAVNGETLRLCGWEWQIEGSDPEPLLEKARQAGVNLLVARGAGAIETDAFYAACDRLGLLVWQELPASLGADALETTVARRRHHPSLSLWLNGPVDAGQALALHDPGREWRAEAPHYAPLHVTAESDETAWRDQARLRAGIQLHNAGEACSLLNVVVTLADVEGEIFLQENLAAEAPARAAEWAGEVEWRRPRDYAGSLLLQLQVIDEEGEILAENGYLRTAPTSRS
jgi:glucosamine--fructose-6-phosphate aminotransferase (isomerizing)